MTSDTENALLTEMGALFEKHIAVARTSLRIAQCFSAMRDFENKVSGLNGVEFLRFEPGNNRQYLEAGLVRLCLKPGGWSHVAGHWFVEADGTATIDFLVIPVITVRGPQLSAELLKVRLDGHLKLVIDAVAASAREADFLPDFGAV